jgi:hypothetical protein
MTRPELTTRIEAWANRRGFILVAINFDLERVAVRDPAEPGAIYSIFYGNGLPEEVNYSDWCGAHKRKKD